MNYPVIGRVKLKSGQIFPLVDIPMMSDERWEELAREQAVKNYIRENKREPHNVEEALEWQHRWISTMKTV